MSSSPSTSEAAPARHGHDMVLTNATPKLLHDRPPHTAVHLPKRMELNDGALVKDRSDTYTA